MRSPPEKLRGTREAGRTVSAGRHSLTHSLTGTLMMLGDLYGEVGDEARQKMSWERCLQIGVGHFGPEHATMVALQAKLAELDNVQAQGRM